MVAMTTELKQLDVVASEHGWNVAYKGQRRTITHVGVHERSTEMQDIVLSSTYTKSDERLEVLWDEDQRAVEAKREKYGSSCKGHTMSFEFALGVLTSN
ncbi:Uncharacterised protein [Mycobacteroides abscessus subsp. abscessus]|nr:Uncharacterised protein [Mycobacteroides abscessus subsp. abscessus]